MTRQPCIQRYAVAYIAWLACVIQIRAYRLMSNVQTSRWSASLNAKEKEKSGVYEFIGDQPPPEFAKLFGIKTNAKSSRSIRPPEPVAEGAPKRKKGSVTVDADAVPPKSVPKSRAKPNVTKSSSKKKEKVEVNVDDAIAELESTLIRKYKSSAYKDLEEDDEDEAEWEELRGEKKKTRKDKRFEGFEAMNKGEGQDGARVKGVEVGKSAPKSVPGDENKVEDVVEDAPRRSILLGRITRRKAVASPDDVSASASSEGWDDYEGGSAEQEDPAVDYRRKQREAEDLTRSGPLQAVDGYRLRKPPPLSVEAQAKIAAAEEAQRTKEAGILERKKAKRKDEDIKFAPFEFGDAGSAEEEGESLFTAKSFDEIGVRDSTVLRNLERIRIFNPTRIQELAVPLLSSGGNIVMQAQTGSGKTLAYLLPLLSVIDPSARRVQAVILAPSRELVSQIAQVGEVLFKDTGIGIISIIGGANVRGQVERLREDRPQVRTARTCLYVE